MPPLPFGGAGGHQKDGEGLCITFHTFVKDLLLYSSSHPCIIVACGQPFTRAAHKKRFSSRTRRDYTMKLKNVAVVAAALALAVGMTACGGSASSTTASSAASSAAASSEAASSEAASSEAESSPPSTLSTTPPARTSPSCTCTLLAREDKGENLAADGLADGDSVVLTCPRTLTRALSMSWSSPPRAATPRASTPWATRLLPSPC